MEDAAPGTERRGKDRSGAPGSDPCYYQTMAKYELYIPHSLTVDEVRTRLSRATPKLEAQYGAQCRWEAEDRLLVSRKGLDAQVQVEPERVRVNMELGFLMSAVGPAIRAGITKQLQDLLASPSPSPS